MLILGGILKRIHQLILAAAIILAPVIYALGRKKGADAQKAVREADIAKRNADIADFYKRMAEREEDTLDRTDRDALIDRLRGKGL